MMLNSLQNYLITDITADDIETLSTYELDKTIIVPARKSRGKSTMSSMWMMTHCTK